MRRSVVSNEQWSFSLDSVRSIKLLHKGRVPGLQEEIAMKKSITVIAVSLAGMLLAFPALLDLPVQVADRR